MTPLEWARRAAITYRNALHRADPHTCQQLDQQTRRAGQHWLLPTELPEGADTPATLDAELTARDIEQIWRIPAATIYAWASKGLLTKRCANDGTPVYRVGDVFTCQARNHQPRPPQKPSAEAEPC